MNHQAELPIDPKSVLSTSRRLRDFLKTSTRQVLKSRGCGIEAKVVQAPAHRNVHNYGSLGFHPPPRRVLLASAVRYRYWVRA